EAAAAVAQASGPPCGLHGPAQGVQVIEGGCEPPQGEWPAPGENVRSPFVVEAHDVPDAEAKTQPQGDESARGRARDEVEIVGDPVADAFFDRGQEGSGDDPPKAPSVDGQNASHDRSSLRPAPGAAGCRRLGWSPHGIDRKSTRLNSSHVKISY